MIKLNGIPVNITIFPDKTSQVWKVEGIKRFNFVTWEFEHEGEFMHLAQLKDLLDAELTENFLTVNYLPYARQDKPLSNSTAFALFTFSKLLNSLRFDRVSMFDVHSYKATALIKNSHNELPVTQVSALYSEYKWNLCFPDKGASERYPLGNYTPLILEKTRDQLTGALTMNSLTQKLNGGYLIVDDICDGGGTFILAANELYKAGASDVYLYVSHGIFSKGTQVLRDAGIKRIFTLKGEVYETY